MISSSCHLNGVYPVVFIQLGKMKVHLDPETFLLFLNVEIGLEN